MSNVIEFPFAKKTVTIEGVEMTFREITVAENDECADAATGPNNEFSGRTMMRMMIMKSSVDPVLDSEALAAMPNRVYIQIYDVVNELNTLNVSEDEVEEEGNA